MKIKVSKSYKWEMGHRLTFHDGPCRNIHGHSYRLRIDIVGEPGTNGMVIDYYDIDKAVKPFIETLDHAFLVNDKDSSTIEFLKSNRMKYKVVPFFSTAENIVSYFMEELYPAFAIHKNLHSLELRIYETEDAFAEISRDLK
jgi:6-pyruvoyltetrahydropterin/6-carboxytetrahydropterin synthase